MFDPFNSIFDIYNCQPTIKWILLSKRPWKMEKKNEKNKKHKVFGQWMLTLNKVYEISSIQRCSIKNLWIKRTSPCYGIVKCWDFGGYIYVCISWKKFSHNRVGRKEEGKWEFSSCSLDLFQKKTASLVTNKLSK